MSTTATLRTEAVRVANRAARLLPARAQEVARRLGALPDPERVRWFGARSVQEASQALAVRAEGLLSGGQWVLILGADEPLKAALSRECTRRGLEYRCAETPAGLAPAVDPQSLGCILAADVEVARITETARAILADGSLAGIPFEYAMGLERELAQFRRQDEYPDGHFISPVLLADPSPYELYSESLRLFEQKCGLRDYLDLYQLLQSVLEREVEGDVVEFGSYKGHSGWLIATTLRRLGSRKNVDLFDTFENFPVEPEGVDYFWSGTHRVELDEVRRKLEPLEGVRLVQGEFEQTLPSSGVEQIALAYVDCDSHRAVAYVADALYEDHLAPGGFMVFEDYGHPALLGCRTAVHEFFDLRTDCLRFFSQFSGLYVVMKLG